MARYFFVSWIVLTALLLSFSAHAQSNYQLIEAHKSDTSVHLSAADRAKLVSETDLSISGQILTHTKTDGTTVSITLPDKVDITAAVGATVLPPLGSADAGTVYVIPDDGAYLLNGAGDAFVEIADIAVTQNAVIADFATGSANADSVLAYTPSVLNNWRPDIVVATQTEAQTTTVPPQGIIQVGVGTNLLGVYRNITGINQVWIDDDDKFVSLYRMGATHSHETLEKITLSNTRWTSGTSAAATFSIVFNDVDGNAYPSGTFLVSGTLTPWTGSSAPITFNNTVWSGTATGGHNKQGSLDFTWNPASTSTPNGISSITVTGTTAQAATSFAIEFEDTNYSVSGSDVTAFPSTPWIVKGSEPPLDIDDISEWSGVEQNIKQGAIRKVTGTPTIIIGRTAPDSDTAADGGSSPDGTKWEDITSRVSASFVTVDLDARTEGGTYFATYGDPKVFIFQGGKSQNILFPTAGVTNANMRAIIQNDSTADLTVAGKTVPSGGGAIVTSTGSIVTVTVWEGAANDNRIEYRNITAMYFQNGWVARSFTAGGVSPGDGISAADNNSHYQIQRDMVLDLLAMMDGTEGQGYSIGLQWQVYKNGVWDDPDNKYGVTGDAGNNPALNDNERVYLRSGEYIRLRVNGNDGGRNTYAGNRSIRIFVQEQ